MAVIDIFNTRNRYELILADPPWQQNRGGRKRGHENSSGKGLPYPTCSLAEIKTHLEAASALSDGDCVLFLWTIDKYLIEAQRMAESLGYKLHARMIWNKVNGIPAAFTIRYGHEYLLWFYRGKLPKIAPEQRGKIHSVFTEKVKRHSQKPEIAFEIIEKLYPDMRKLEMYARQERPGWDCWGNEV